MLINHKTVEDNLITQLIKDIQHKKELRGISYSFVKRELLQILKHRPIQGLENSKSANYKLVVKEVRRNLRKAAGLFSSGTTLETHSSTKERFYSYSQLYKEIFFITGRPASILDLGCGLNPLSYRFMKVEAVYHAYDINGQNVKIIKKFFKKHNLNGKAEVKDILKVKQFPAADVAFLFKMTDILDRGKGHKTAEAVIKRIPAKYVVVSFPLLTMSGKPMNFPRRKWIELMCNRLSYKFKIIKFSTEIFYVIKLN